MAKELQKKNVLLMIFLRTITLGIYDPIWFLSQKDALNDLKAKERISSTPHIFVLATSIIFVALFIILALRVSIAGEGLWFDVLFLPVFFLFFILVSCRGMITLIISLKVRRILNEHFSIKLSGGAIQFLDILYLQHKINHLLETEKQRENGVKLRDVGVKHSQSDYQDLSSGKNIKEYFNKGISARIGILIIVLIVVLAGGILAWQFWPEEGAELPESEGGQAIVPKTLKAVEYFPFVSSVHSIYPDPQNANLVWIMTAGALLEYNLKTDNIERTLTGVDGLDNGSSVVHKGDFIFFDVRAAGGFSKKSLSTGEVKTYTESDGLVNGANIHLFEDPYDNNILWIGTFNGLSLFNIKDETFMNFQREMDNRSVKWSVNGRVYVTKDFVWVIVVSNASSPGAIARLDKKTWQWETWGPEFFDKDRRVDFDSFCADEENAFVGVGEKLYRFNEGIMDWNLVQIEMDEENYYFSSLISMPDRLYFKINGSVGQNTLKYFNLDNDVIYNAAGIDIADYSSVALYGDEKNKKIFITEWGEKKDILLYDPFEPEKKITKIKFFNEDIFKMDKLNSVDKDIIFLEGDNNLFAYYLSTKSLNILNQGSFSPYYNSFYRARVFQDKMAILESPYTAYGGFDCDDVVPKLIIMSVDDFGDKVEIEVDNYSCVTLLTMGDSLNEIFVEFRTKGKEHVITQFNPNTQVFEEISLSWKEIEEKYDIDASRDMIEVGSGLAVRVDREKKESIYPEIEIRQALNGNWETKILPVAPEKYSPFGWPDLAYVNDFKFDPLHPEVVWVGTTRGLIRFNTLNNESTLFTTGEGLADNEIKKVFIGDKIIIEHPFAIAIYDY